jgi:iron complex outermembrane receptor protein
MFEKTARGARPGATANTTNFAAAMALSASAFALAWTPAYAQNAQPAPEEVTDEGEAIVVTGTILRGNANSVSPVGTLTAEDLSARGQTTIAETLETISGNAGGSLPNSFTANGAFASGASGVSLRGLLTSNTLVLVDGLRPAYYPLADDGVRNFVDVNTIPQAVVDRIETLKDGASSTYGADAIAGVINIITRSEYEGAQLTLDRGFRGGGDGAEQLHFSGIWGTGDLGENGFNFYLAAEYQHDDVFYGRDADFFPATTADLSSICATSIVDDVTETCAFNGVFWGMQHDGTFAGVTARGYGSPNAMIRRRNAAGTGYDALDDFELLDTSCNAHTEAGVIPAQGVAGFNNDVNVCTLDAIQEYSVISPESERASISGRMTFRLNDGAEAYLMATYYQNEVFNPVAPQNIRLRMTPSTTGVIFRTDTGPTEALLPVYVCPTGSYTYVCQVGDPGAVLNPNNPYAADGREAGIWYNFGDIEGSNRNFAQTFRGAGGVTGDFQTAGREFHYDVALSAMQTNLEREVNGALYFPNLMAAIRQGTYNFVDPSLNTDAIRDFIAPTSTQRSESRLVQLQANLSTDLFNLPAGPVVGGVSFAARYESLDNPSANSDRLGPANRYLTINPFGASGSRDVESVAFEIAAPVLETLDISLSGRYDTYSTGQSDFSPKAGFRFQPLDWLAFRGTYSEGFRIPSFAESFADPSTGFTVVNAPADWCDVEHGDGSPGSGDVSYCQGYGLGNTLLATPDLEPETSTNINLGVVLQPFDNWTFSADYYQIEKEEVIGTASPAAAIAAYYAGDPIPGGFTIIPDVPNPNNLGGMPRIAFVQAGYQNLGEQATHGWDFQLSGRHELGAVTWTTSAEATWLQSLTQQFPGGEEQEYAGTIGPYIITAASGTPHWRLNWQNTFDFGRASVTATAYWTEGYLSVAEDNAGDADDDSCLSGTAGGTPATYLDGETPIVCKVDDSFYIDLHGQYDFTDQFQLFMDISNVLDEEPAFDPTTYGAHTPSYNPAWGTPGILGRFFTIGARARF